MTPRLVRLRRWGKNRNECDILALYMMKLRATFFALLLAFVVYAACPSELFADDGLGTVSVLVVGPDGDAVRNHAVTVKPIKLSFFNDASDNSGKVSYLGRTDASGRLSIQVPFGLFLAQIIVPGVGFGATGVVEVQPNTPLFLTIPRLAPFATISGEVTPALIKPGVHVALDPSFGGQQSSALIDAQGHFTLTDLWPGTVHLIIPEEIPAGMKPSYAFAESEVINVQPGDQFTRMHIVAPDSLALLPSPQAPVAAGAKGPTIMGTVMDTVGTPVPNVPIYAFISCQSIIDGGGHGRTQSVRTVVTDANGKYALRDLPTGEPEFPGTDVSLLAVKRDSVPSVTTAHLMPDDTTDAKNPNGDQTINLILPNHSPALDIRVLEAGKPVEGARVQLSPHWGSLLYSAQYIIGGITADAPNPLDYVFHPSLTTNSDGVAAFRNLAPGLWDVMTSHDQANRITTTNASVGVIVQADRINRYTLSLLNEMTSVPIHVAAPTSQTEMKHQGVFAETTLPDDQSADSNASLDTMGNSLLNLTTPGLWKIDSRFPCMPSNGLDVNEPCYEASSVIVCAPEILKPSTILLRPVRADPGCVRIKLRDRRGRPVMGSVLMRRQLTMIAAGSTDEHGEILFPGIPGGYYQLNASLLGRPPLPTLGNETAPLSEDRVLTGHAVLLPEGADGQSNQLFGPSVSVQADHETDMVFQLHPVGYIKGRLLAPQGDAFNDCQFAGTSATGRIPQLQLLKTGEFVSGPYLEGNAEFRIERNTHGVYGEAVTGPPSRATVSSRHVTRVDVMTSPPSPSQIRAARNQAREQEGEGPLNGRVFLSDGKTPAWAACAVVVRPSDWDDAQSAATDALGRLINNGSLGGVSAHSGKAGPNCPVIVAYLPGECGAVIARYRPDKPLHLTLPPPVSLHGKITFGGRPVADSSSTFWIRAAYQGQGGLNDLLSIETTAQADGTFELDGLTPGVYQVQAARDGIWLSRTQTVVVGQDALPDRTFDIGVPGRAMLFHFRDQSGNPLIGKTVTLVRPDGPLTDALWPKTLTTDGAGDLRLEGLEAGPQSMIVEVEQASGNEPSEKQKARRAIRFVVPDYAPGEQAVEKTVLLSGDIR